MKTKAFAVLAAIVLGSSGRAAAQGLVDAPGTPLSGYPNLGGPTVIFSEGGGVGVQSTFNTDPFVVDPSFTAIAGDVVFLQDPAEGDAPPNWAAVLEFFNPADPTGTLGLNATRYETFLPNNTPGGFANLVLLPNTIYLTQGTPTAPGDLSAGCAEFGPQGEINAGQEAIIIFSAAPQPDAVPESGTLGWIVCGSIALFSLRRRTWAKCKANPVFLQDPMKPTQLSTKPDSTY